jgi:CO/xanthine dehydrogenase Mo-binding subunit
LSVRSKDEHRAGAAHPAIANAIYDAVGVRPAKPPPYLPEKVYLAMLDAGVVS